MHAQIWQQQGRGRPCSLLCIAPWRPASRTVRGSCTALQGPIPNCTTLLLATYKADQHARHRQAKLLIQTIRGLSLCTKADFGSIHKTNAEPNFPAQLQALGRGHKA